MEKKTEFGVVRIYYSMADYDTPLKECKVIMGEADEFLTVNGIRYHVSGEVYWDGNKWSCWPTGWRKGQVSTGLTESARRKFSECFLTIFCSLTAEDEKKARLDHLAFELLEAEKDIAEIRDQLDFAENRLRTLQGVQIV